MPDYKIKVSRQGYDVKTAADHQLYFSSDFPLLKRFATGTFEVNAGTGEQLIHHHGLGYYPLFMIYSGADDYNYNYVADTAANTPEYGSIYCTDNDLFVDTDTYTNNHNIKWEIYALDLESAVDYGNSNLTPGGRATYADYIMKITKDGADVSSTDPRDFVIDTTKRSLIVHKVLNTTQNTSDPLPSDGISWYVNAHSLGYPPVFLVFAKDDVGPGYYNIQSPSFNFAIGDDTNITIGANLSGYGASSYTDVSIVVFKDAISSVI